MQLDWWIRGQTSTLKILFWYRSISVLGQVAALLIAKMIFEFPLYLNGVITVVGLLVLVNIFTWFRARNVNEANSLEIFSQLLIDVMALSALFYFSGGATNPFVSMYLLPLAMGAILLSANWVLLLSIISIAAYSYLMWGLPHDMTSEHAHHADHLFDLHVLGMWVSFVLSAGVIAFFVVKMRTSLQLKDQQLLAAREQAIKDEKLVALGALAASTAHEMGTPLGTIQLIISDLQENNISQSEIDTLLEQVRRCKQALTEISTAANDLNMQSDGLTSFKPFLENLLSDWQQDRPNVNLTAEFKGEENAGVVAEKTLAKALVNLFDNAADASPNSVNVKSSWQAHEAKIIIADQGEGIDPNLISEIGTKP
ncbi:MAG: sensor histidine kinase, partial [Pseudomonadota bacterium]